MTATHCSIAVCHIALHCNVLQYLREAGNACNALLQHCVGERQRESEKCSERYGIVCVLCVRVYFLKCVCVCMC